ncbi:MAG: 3-deoxy-7-phosphoheptulonate synthase, partial [Candidatus Zixiibacteriota bacterium]
MDSHSHKRDTSFLILFDTAASEQHVADVCNDLARLGLKTHVLRESNNKLVEATGDGINVDLNGLLGHPGVRDIIETTHPYKLVSRTLHQADTVIQVGDVSIGGNTIVVMAGPCAVESREQCLRIAELVARFGARVFRGGAYKPRTSPYSFQGLAEEGLKVLADVRREHGLLVVTEAMDTETIDLVVEHADIVQIGSRNMHNFSLLRRAGRLNKPILLKRGMSATLEEFLMAAEYIMTEGNHQVILCERGVRTFADHTRNTLDLSIVPAVKQISHLPIIVDPSHGTGVREQVA